MARTFTEEPGKLIIDNSLKGLYVMLPILFILIPFFALGGYAGWISQGSPNDYVALFCVGLVLIVELGIVWLFFTITSDTFTFDKTNQKIIIERKGLIKKTQLIRSFTEMLQLKTETRRVQSGKYSGLKIILTLDFRDGTNLLLALLDPGLDPSFTYLRKPAPQVGQHIADFLNIPLVQGKVEK